MHIKAEIASAIIVAKATPATPICIEKTNKKSNPTLTKPEIINAKNGERESPCALNN